MNEVIELLDSARAAIESVDPDSILSVLIDYDRTVDIHVVDEDAILHVVNPDNISFIRGVYYAPAKEHGFVRFSWVIVSDDK